MRILRITRESWVVFGGHWRITRRDRDAGRTPGLHERAGFQSNARLPPARSTGNLRARHGGRVPGAGPLAGWYGWGS